MGTSKIGRCRACRETKTIFRRGVCRSCYRNLGTDSPELEADKRRTRKKRDVPTSPNILQHSGPDARVEAMRLLVAVVEASGTTGAVLTAQRMGAGLGLVCTWPETTPRSVAAEIGARAARTFADALATAMALDPKDIAVDAPRETER